jgi:hypothetical protein
MTSRCVVLGQRSLPILIVATLLTLSGPRCVEATGWSATYDAASAFDHIDAVFPTADGGYLFSSETGKHLTKVSGAGEVIWSREMLYGAARELLIPTGDGFFVLGYRTLARLNGLGDVVWWRTLSALNPSLARAWPDGTFLISAVYETGDRPFIAKLTSSGQVLWRMSIDLPVLSTSDVSWVGDLLPLDDGSFLALMTTFNFQIGEGYRSADYVVRFSATGAVVWARALVAMGWDHHPQITGVTTLGKTAGGGYFAYGSSTLIALDATGNVKGFRAGLPSSDHGIRPTMDGGYIVVGRDYSSPSVEGPLVQKLDRQLNSEWGRKFPSGASSHLNSIAPTPAGGWIVGGEIVPPGQSQFEGWSFRLASGGQPFGDCPASVLVEHPIGNGHRQCEVQVTYPSPPPSVPIATVTHCDSPAVPPGFSPVRQDFDLTCGSGAQPNGVQCTVTTRNNYSSTFYVSARDGSGPLYVGPNASATIDLIYTSDSPPGTNFIDVSTPGIANITSAPASVFTQPGLALTSVQAPISWLPYSLSRSLLCSGEPEGCLDPALDSDEDALPDCIELYGLSDPISGQMLLDLPTLGANPYHKDVFVEVDYLSGKSHSHRPNPRAIALAELAMAELAVSNPDGRPGVNLHVDHGQWGALSESDSFAGLDDLYLHDEDPDYWTALEALKGTQVAPGRLGFSIHRRGIFHYSVFGHYVDSNGFSGDSRGIPGAEFVIGMGGFSGGIGTCQQQAGTFLHELGHNLGLRHGGNDRVHRKPNYRSVMNYSFQTSSLLSFSMVELPPLNEAQLNESTGIGSTEWTIYRCPTAPRYVANGSAIDWNCNGTPGENNVVADINGGPETELRGFADVNHIDFHGIRPAGATLTDTRATEPGQEHEELTAEEDLAIPKPENLIVEALLSVVQLAWGETSNVSFRVSNLGVEGDTYDLIVYSTAGFVLSGALGPIVLDGGEATLVDIAVTAPAAGEPGVSDLVLIVTGRRQPELPEEVTVRVAVGSSEPLDFYTLSPCRMADTRPASALASDLVRIFPVGSLCGVPPSARAVAVNITVAQPSGYGNVVLFPAGQALATTSTINFGPGQVRANNAILQLGSDAGLAAVAFVAGGGGVHLILDVTGYFE